MGAATMLSLPTISSERRPRSSPSHLQAWATRSMREAMKHEAKCGCCACAISSTPLLAFSLQLQLTACTAMLWGLPPGCCTAVLMLTLPGAGALLCAADPRDCLAQRRRVAQALPAGIAESMLGPQPLVTCVMVQPSRGLPDSGVRCGSCARCRQVPRLPGKLAFGLQAAGRRVKRAPACLLH